MLHLFVKSNIVDYIDGIDLEVDPDIKRSIKTDVIDIGLALEIKPGECGSLVGIEMYGNKPSGNVYSTDDEVVVGSIKVLLRKEDGEEDCGTLLALRGLVSLPTLGMSKWAKNSAVNGMVATLQIQQWLEQQGVLSKDPAEDQDNTRMLVDVVNEEPVFRILSDDEVIDLALEA